MSKANEEPLSAGVEKKSRKRDQKVPKQDLLIESKPDILKGLQLEPTDALLGILEKHEKSKSQMATTIVEILQSLPMPSTAEHQEFKTNLEERIQTMKKNLTVTDTEIQRMKTSLDELINKQSSMTEQIASMTLDMKSRPRNVTLLQLGTSLQWNSTDKDTHMRALPQPIQEFLYSIPGLITKSEPSPPWAGLLKANTTPPPAIATPPSRAIAIPNLPRTLDSVVKSSIHFLLKNTSSEACCVLKTTDTLLEWMENNMNSYPEIEICDMVSDDVTGKLTLAKYDNKNARHAREESGVVFITMLYYHHNTNEIEKMISRLSSGEDLSSTDRTTMEMVEKQRNRH